MVITDFLMRNFKEISRCYNPIKKIFLTRIKFFDAKNNEEIIIQKTTPTLLLANKFSSPIIDKIERYWNVKIEIKGNFNNQKGE